MTRGNPGGVSILCSLALLLGGAGLDAFFVSFCAGLAPPARADQTVKENPGVTAGSATGERGGAKQQSDNSGEPPAAQTSSEKPLPACLSAIARATAIEDAGLRSARLKENLIAAQMLGPSARALLIEMIHSATPSGRLLAVALLKKLDGAEYQKQAAALQQESGNDSVSVITPTERCHYSVSDILSDMASKKPLIKLLPDVAAK